MNESPITRIYSIAGAVLFTLAALFLLLTYFGSWLNVVWFVLYNFSVIAAAFCLRRASNSTSFGYSSIVVVLFAYACFMFTALLVGPGEPKKHPPGPVGAQSWANMFEGLWTLFTFPLIFAPIALPAFFCWIGAISTERWPAGYHVPIGIATVIAC